ncbi:hypothetical protein AN1V17_41150 [Vallitalea sediminicola]
MLYHFDKYTYVDILKIITIMELTKKLSGINYKLKKIVVGCSNYKKGFGNLNNTGFIEIQN